ncbi:MAG: hypothetical protein Q8N56_00120 [bacterium]|nr:hypothetical protein [bacterium]
MTTNAYNLRKKYPLFVYKDYCYAISGKNLEIFFDFRIPPDFIFQPKIVIKNVPLARIKKIGERVLNNFIFNLGLIEMFSYWKATCSPEIVIEAGFLDQAQIHWWQDLLIRGMGQYFFENKIDFRAKEFVVIENSRNNPDEKSLTVKNLPGLKNWFLVPVGGGKDSAIVLEMLKKAKKEVCCFGLNPSQAAKKIMAIFGGKNPVIVERKIDPKLFELNHKGFLNGHTPFSAYLAFLSTFCAALFGYKYIALANERSAEEGNVRYMGEEINHQYSKSFEFEQKFRAYCQKYLAKNIEYFSLLRPLYELQIAKMFSRYPKYFKAFLSCNQAQATKSGRQKPTGKWCGQCPKCLFVFICLYPFLDKKKIIEIFHKNLFEDKKLLAIMEQLTGKRGFKPFECVGTARETRAALQGGNEMAKILHSWGSRHNLSLNLTRILKKQCVC